MSPLRFKARVGNVCDVFTLRFTSGATPDKDLMARMAASHFPHIPVSAELIEIWYCYCKEIESRKYERYLYQFLNQVL